MQLQRRDDFEPAPRTILWLMPGHQPTLPLACHGSVGDHTTSRPDRQTLQCLVFGNRSDRSHLPTRQDLWSGALNQEGVNAHEIPQNQLLEFRFRVRSVSQFPVTRLYVHWTALVDTTTRLIPSVCVSSLFLRLTGVLGLDGERRAKPW
jgi:hypothetical protein